MKQRKSLDTYWQHEHDHRPAIDTMTIDVPKVSLLRTIATGLLGVITAVVVGLALLTAIVFVITL